MNMRIKGLVMILMMFFLLTSCSQKTKIVLPENVSQISIAPYGSADMTFVYTEETKVDTFINFLKSLEVKNTQDSPENYEGVMLYNITLITSNSEAHYTMSGSTFFKAQNDNWMSISYEKGEEFIKLLKDNIPDIQAKKQLFDYSN